MSADTDENEIERLREAIRKHRDKRGHERCWENDAELYSVLNEPIPDPELPSREEFLEQCTKYYEGQTGESV